MPAFYENKSSAFFCRDIEGHVLECSMHLHYNLEIAFIYEGKTEVTIDNMPLQIAEGGDVVVVFPNQVHAFSTKVPERHVLLIADPLLLSEFATLFTDHLPVCNVIRGAANDSELRSLVQRISSLFREEDMPRKDIILRGYLLAFIGKLFYMMNFRRVESGDIQAIGSVMNYCIAHYNENLSLDMLEKKLHISKYYISHVMNKKLNMGFNDYVNSIRISNACRMLSGSNLHIREICDAVGFNTVRTFNRAFVKYMGMSPREYRNKSICIKEV